MDPTPLVPKKINKDQKWTQGYSIWSYERKNQARNGPRAIAFGNSQGNRNKPKPESFGPQTGEKSNRTRKDSRLQPLVLKQEINQTRNESKALRFGLRQGTKCTANGPDVVKIRNEPIRPDIDPGL